jgi:UDP-glucose 4-epimerase
MFVPPHLDRKIANVLIAGGAGFIGSHLMEALMVSEWKVSILDNLSGGSLENIKPGLSCKVRILNSYKSREVLDGYEKLRRKGDTRNTYASFKTEPR